MISVASAGCDHPHRLLTSTLSYTSKKFIRSSLLHLLVLPSPCSMKQLKRGSKSSVVDQCYLFPTRGTPGMESTPCCLAFPPLYISLKRGCLSRPLQIIMKVRESFWFGEASAMFGWVGYKVLQTHFEAIHLYCNILIQYQIHCLVSLRFGSNNFFFPWQRIIKHKVKLILKDTLIFKNYTHTHTHKIQGPPGMQIHLATTTMV